MKKLRQTELDKFLVTEQLSANEKEQLKHECCLFIAAKTQQFPEFAHDFQQAIQCGINARIDAEVDKRSRMAYAMSAVWYEVVRKPALDLRPQYDWREEMRQMLIEFFHGSELAKELEKEKEG